MFLCPRGSLFHPGDAESGTNRYRIKVDVYTDWHFIILASFVAWIFGGTAFGGSGVYYQCFFSPHM